MTANLYLTYEEVFGKRATKAEINQQIGRLSLRDVLSFIAFINHTFLSPPSRHRNDQSMLIKTFFSSEDLDRIATASTNLPKSQNSVFHRQQLLLLTELALELCVDYETEEAVTVEDRWRFGRACLMVNDLLIRDRVQTCNDDELELATVLLPLVELYVNSEVLNLLARAQQLWGQLLSHAQRGRTRNALDLNTTFLTHYNFTVSDLCAVIMALIARAMKFRPDASDWFDSIVIDASVATKSTSYSEEKFRTVLEAIASEPNDLANQISTRPRQTRGDDFNLLRRWPLIHVTGEKYLIYDQMLLSEFLVDGIFWMIHDSLSVNQQEAFRTQFGDIYELYISELVQATMNTSAFFLTNFKIGNDEVCDILLLQNSDLFIIEVKGKFLSPHAKYSGSSKALKNEIDSKFVGDKNHKHAVMQLASGIARFDKERGFHTIGISQNQIRRIYPVMVCSDATMHTPLIPKYLNRKLLEYKRTFGESASKLAPLSVLISRDIELMNCMPINYDIGRIFDEAHRAAPPSSVYDIIAHRYQGRFNVTTSLMGRRFQSFVQDASAAFSPGNTSNDPTLPKSAP